MAKLELRLPRRPGQSLIEEAAEERRVERGQVVAEERAEDAPLATLEGPRHGLRRAFLLRLEEDRHPARVPDPGPVTLVDEVRVLDAPHDRVAARPDDLQPERAVAELRLAG